MSEILLTVSDLLREAKRLGIKLSPRTFWSYCEQGLLPEGRKLPGRGNCLYFEGNALSHLYAVVLFKSLRLSKGIVASPGSGKTHLLLKTMKAALEGCGADSLPPIDEGRRRVETELRRTLFVALQNAFSANREQVMYEAEDAQR
jgi:hypothetical protein